MYYLEDFTLLANYCLLSPRLLYGVWVKTRVLFFGICGRKFIEFLYRVGDPKRPFVVSNAISRLSVSCLIPKIFAVFAEAECNRERITIKALFLPEPNYVTLRSSLRCRKSVCLSFVTSVHPTQEFERFGNISSPLYTLTVLWPSYKIYGDRALNAREVANRMILDLSHKRPQDAVTGPIND